jgi:two-component system, cell cycle response regulator
MAEKKRLSNRDILMLFNYAARLVAIESDSEQIFERSLEALSVLANDRKVAFYALTKQMGMLQLEGIFAERVYRPVKMKIPYVNTPFEKVITGKEYGIYPAPHGGVFGVSLPVYDPHPDGASCLCLPVGGTSNNIVGVVTVERHPGERWSVFDIQMFITFATVIAMSIENSRLYKLATIDGLTGLFVRTFFEIRLDEEIARIRRNGGALSVLLIDIDNFKEINDIYGHPHGDTVLKGFASVLEGAIRKEIDIPCRYGGDEFTVLILGAGPEDSLTLAKRIKGQFESRVFSMGGEARNFTISAGLATIDSRRMETRQEILDKADQMLYRAKGLGKNRICPWEDKG